MEIEDVGALVDILEVGLIALAVGSLIVEVTGDPAVTVGEVNIGSTVLTVMDFAVEDFDDCNVPRGCSGAGLVIWIVSESVLAPESESVPKS